MPFCRCGRSLIRWVVTDPESPTWWSSTVLVFGCGYKRIADATCSATTLRRRRDGWTRAGVFERLHTAALDTSGQMIGLNLADLSVDGHITKAPCGGQYAGRSRASRG